MCVDDDHDSWWMGLPDERKAQIRNWLSSPYRHEVPVIEGQIPFFDEDGE